MKSIIKSFFLVILSILVFGCDENQKDRNSKSAKDILGNPNYLAMSYGGYRQNTRDIVPTIEKLKDDMKILSAMGIRIIRTYNTHEFAQAERLLEAIKQLKNEDSKFEMYVMLGAWIQCESSWTEKPNHEKGDVAGNTAEIEKAIELTNKYPNIVKIIAVGNEAMVHWASTYFVHPNIILKWVNHLQDLKKNNKIPSDVWITSSDNFASWGGGDDSYHIDGLTELLKAVDYVSLHTYPFHDTHYNPAFWHVPSEEGNLSKIEKINSAMERAKKYAISQYQKTADYIKSVGVDKPVHIGETGWSSLTNSMYGNEGSKAADEYKEKLYYEAMRDWTNNAGMSCFYFEGFDEKWKDKNNELGSENHFGLINLDGQAKYPLWEMVDKGVFKGLTRNGKEITKTYNGDEKLLLEEILVPEFVPEAVE